MEESFNFINEKFYEYEQCRQGKWREINELKENISTLSKRLDDLDSVVDKQYQYSCRKWRHGLENESNKNTNEHVIDVLSKTMSETTSPQDIDRSHMLPWQKQTENQGH